MDFTFPWEAGPFSDSWRSTGEPAAAPFTEIAFEIPLATILFAWRLYRKAVAGERRDQSNPEGQARNPPPLGDCVIMSLRRRAATEAIRRSRREEPKPRAWRGGKRSNPTPQGCPEQSEGSYSARAEIAASPCSSRRLRRIATHPMGARDDRDGVFLMAISGILYIIDSSRQLFTIGI